MDSSYQDQQGNEMGECSLSDTIENILALLKQMEVNLNPSEWNFQQDASPNSTQWSSQFQRNKYAVCNSFPRTTYNAYRRTREAIHSKTW